MKSRKLSIKRIGLTDVHFPQPDIVTNDLYIDYSGIIDKLVDVLKEDEGPAFSVCLRGRPGVGKTSACMAVSRILGYDVFTLQGSSDTNAQDVVIFPVPSSANTFSAVASPLTAAVVSGSMAVFDEIGKVARYSPAALSPLASLLDHRGSIYSDFCKSTIDAKPSFRFLCTMQPDECLPAELTSRMLTFEMEPPPVDVVFEILLKTAPAVPGVITLAFREWASQKQNLVPRDANLIVHYAQRRARRLNGQVSAKMADSLIVEASQAVTCSSFLLGDH